MRVMGCPCRCLSLVSVPTMAHAPEPTRHEMLDWCMVCIVVCPVYFLSLPSISLSVFCQFFSASFVFRSPFCRSVVHLSTEFSSSNPFNCVIGNGGRQDVLQHMILRPLCPQPCLHVTTLVGMVVVGLGHGNIARTGNDYSSA